MSYTITPTEDGRFQITHPTIRMVGDWTYRTEREALAMLREMLLDSVWAQREMAAAENAWDQYEREFGDD